MSKDRRGIGSFIATPPSPPWRSMRQKAASGPQHLPNHPGQQSGRITDTNPCLWIYEENWCSEKAHTKNILKCWSTLCFIKHVHISYFNWFPHPRKENCLAGGQESGVWVLLLPPNCRDVLGKPCHVLESQFYCQKAGFTYSFIHSLNNHLLHTY